jgi:hypothetical protein
MFADIEFENERGEAQRQIINVNNIVSVSENLVPDVENGGKKSQTCVIMTIGSAHARANSPWDYARVCKAVRDAASRK